MKKMFLLTACLVLGACATTYQPDSFSGGYDDQQLGPNFYRVTYVCNGYTSLTTCKSFLYRRAVELCREKGFKTFKVIDSSYENTVKSFRNGNIVSKPETELLISCK